ncbi:DUF2341 domain-containing protein [Candidatus Pacearchaeota archaeon]|nr:DUF2341 domain-containing protein [Candidatus Pacearchaeota archaeon]
MALSFLALIGLAFFAVAQTQEEFQAELAQLEGELVSANYSWLINYTGDVSNVFYENYSCENNTGYHTVKVLTAGVHNQLFEFGDVNATAHNFAINRTYQNISDVYWEFQWETNNVKLQVRSCDDANCSGEIFIGYDNTSSTWFNDSLDTSLADINISDNRYFQYKAYLWRNASIGQKFTPILYNVSINKTTSDTTAPSVTINSPLSQSYAPSSILFNVTASDVSSVDTCWYSLDSGANVSMTDSGNYWNDTNVSMTEGSHTVEFYCNDTLGNLNGTESVSFFIEFELDSCSILSLPGTYILTQSVNSSGTCFTIGADNITLNGNGYFINYSQSSLGYAINNTGYNNTIIKNCNITQGGNIAYAYAIYFDNSKNATMQNNTIETNSDSATDYKHAVYFDSTTDSLIENNTINTYGDDYNYGIYLYDSSSNNTISNNTISTTGAYSYGIYVEDYSGNNTILNNTISTTGGYGHGIYIRDYSDNITISNNTITTSVGGSAHGIYFYYSDDHTISNNTITILRASSYGIYFYYSDDNIISNNIISGTNWGIQGAYLRYSDSNSFLNNTISASSSNSVGMTIRESSYLTLKGNSFDISDSYAIDLYSSTTTSYYNHTIDTSNTEQGKPIHYYFNNDSITIENSDNIGQLIVAVSENVTIKNITLDKDGIDLHNTPNSKIENCDISTARAMGIDIYSSPNNTVLNNTVYSTLGHGVYISSSLNSTALNNTISCFDRPYGIFLQFSSSSMVSNNIISAEGCYSTGAIYLKSSSNSVVSNNTVSTTGEGGYGVCLYSSSDNNIVSNNTISTASSWRDYARGIYLRGSDNNTLSNNSISTTGEYSAGIYLYDSSDDNRISNNTISTSEVGSYGIGFRASDDNNITSCSLNTSYADTGDLYLRDADNIKVTDTDYTDIYYYDSTSDLWRYWFLDVYVNGSAGNPINQTNVTAQNLNEEQQFTELTNSSGYITRKTLLEYNQSGVIAGYYSSDKFGNETFYTNYSVHGIKGDSEVTEEVNLTESQTVVLTLESANLIIWDDSDSGTATAWGNKFYANYTDLLGGLGEPVNGSDKWCEFRHNRSSAVGGWSSVVNMSFNASSELYEFTGDCGYLEGHGCVPVGNYSFNVSCYDGSGSYQNISLTDGVSISEYNTSLSIENDTAKAIGEQVNFYANYSAEFGVGGLGLGEREIGRIVWNTSDLDTGEETYSVAYFDCENKGEKDCIVVGTRSNGLRAFYPNGTEMGGNWPGEEAVWRTYEIEIGDLDNDSYYNDIVMIGGGSVDYIRVFNETGDEVWNSGSFAGDVSSVAIADLDKDGLKDDFVAGVNTGAGYKVMAFNTSDGVSWTNFWNGSTTYAVEEIVIGDLDRDGWENDVAVSSTVFGTGYVYAFDGDDGALLFNTTTLNTVHSVAIADLDSDGYRDEVIAGAAGNLFAFEWNGTYGITYTDSADDYIWKATEPGAEGRELAIMDLDNDGLEDDIVFADSGGPLVIRGFDNSGNQLWSHAIFSNGFNPVQSMSVGDIDADGEREVIFSDTDYDILYVLNRTGGLLWEYEINLGDIGSVYGSSPATDVGDVNNDGISDIAVSSKNGYAHILQDVKCTAYFNDSNSYNMTWDSSLNKWKMNRSFITAGNYDYNVSCEKGGYVAQIESSVSSVHSLSMDIVSPNNTTTYYSADIDFNVSVDTDNSDADSCWFELDDSGSNITMSQFNSSYFNYDYSGIIHGLHNISYWCNNSVGREVSATELNFDVVLADVEVSDVSVPTVVYSNVSFIEINVSNIGVPNVTDVNVSCYFDGAVFESKLISSIEGGGYYMTNCTLTETSQMNKLLNVTVDPADVIPEADEGNNGWSSYIDVLQLTGIGVWDQEEDSEGLGIWGSGLEGETLPGEMEYFFANWTMDNSSASVEGGSCSIAFSGGDMAEGWYNSSWSYKKEIVIDYTKVNGSQVNFPVLINLSDSDLVSKAQADGDDIVFADSDGDKLDYEIEYYNGTDGRLVAWVRVAELSNTTNTTINMYYGNAGAVNQENVSGVWDDNFVMVQHLQETPTAYMNDSTSNDNDGTTSGMDSADQVAGQIDGSLDFDGGDDYVGTNYDGILGTNARSTSFWFSTLDTDLVDKNHVVSWGTGADINTAGASWRVDIENGVVFLRINSGATSWGSGLNDGNLHHVALLMPSGGQLQDIRAIINGKDSGLGVGAISVNTISRNSVRIGANNEDVINRWFQGLIDEVRISNVARTAGWIATEYNNQYSPDSFYSVGGEVASSEIDMSYNSSADLYYYNRTFEYAGNYSWELECSKSGFEGLSGSGVERVRIPLFNQTSLGLTTGLTSVNYNEGADLMVNISMGNIDFSSSGYDLEDIWVETTKPDNSKENVSLVRENGSCPEGMAYVHKLDGYCIDKWEASMPSANSTDMGNATEVANRNNPGSMVAESKKGVVPWVRVSQISARTACVNAGKRLCTDEEWLGASNMQGQVYNLPIDLAVGPYGCVTNSSTYCLDHSFENGEACNTGYNNNGESGCYSSEGVYDMVGNVWEWTNETVDVTNPDGSAGWKYPNSTQGWQTTTGAETAIYGNDGTYFPLTTAGRAVGRGGYWDTGTLAGPFCAALDSAPTLTHYYLGFRCCSS